MAYSRSDPRPWRAPGVSWYNTPRWRSLRRRILRRDPICRLCRTRFADTVDHVTPHKGDAALFFDPRNLQGLCERCHNSTKRRDENVGRPRGSDLSGLPLDPDSPWYNGAD